MKLWILGSTGLFFTLLICFYWLYRAYTTYYNTDEVSEDLARLNKLLDENDEVDYKTKIEQQILFYL